MTTLLQPRPGLDDPRPWAFPQVERATLPNGIELLLCHVPDRDVIDVRLVVGGGAVDEPAGLEGLGLLVSRALAEGTTSRSGDTFVAAVEALGAGFDVEPEWHASIPRLSVPASHIVPALGLMAEAVAEPAFLDSDIERLVRMQIGETASRLQYPQTRAHTSFSAAAFADCRMAVGGEGTVESIGRITPEDVRAFWRDNVFPAGSTAVVVGDLTGLGIEDLMADTLGRWECEAPRQSKDRPEQRHRSRSQVRIVDFPGSVQTYLLIGEAAPPVPLADRAATRVALHYLGGFFSSRLTTRLREEKAITYGVGGSLEHRGSASVLRIETAVQADATAEAVADIVAEVDALASGNVEAATFDAAVDNLYRVAPIGFESGAAIASTLVRTILEDLPVDYFDDVREAMRTTTPAQASEAFTRYLGTSRLSVVAVGDASRIAEGLRTLDRLGLDVEDVVEE